LCSIGPVALANLRVKFPFLLRATRHGCWNHMLRKPASGHAIMLGTSPSRVSCEQKQSAPFGQLPARRVNPEAANSRKIVLALEARRTETNFVVPTNGWDGGKRSRRSKGEQISRAARCGTRMSCAGVEERVKIGRRFLQRQNTNVARAADGFTARGDARNGFRW